MLLTSLTVATLWVAALGPSPDPDPTEPRAPAPTLESDDTEYRAALDRLRTAIDMANQDPEIGSSALRDALTLVRNHRSELAEDPAGQELRTLAQLTLARALLAIHDADGSRAAMDEAIRTSRGDPLPSKSFGPGLVALHREREQVLRKAGFAAIVVDCHGPCRVFLNERPTPLRTDALALGNYRVWIEATDGATPSVAQDVTLERPEQELRLVFGEPPAEPEPEPGPTPTEAKPRLIPRWAEIVLMSAGAAAIGTGAALWAIDGRCPDRGDPDDPIACPQVYTTKTAGIATLAAGGAVFLSGVVLLSVDEVRVRERRGSTVSLTWALRF